MPKALRGLKERVEKGGLKKAWGKAKSKGKSVPKALRGLKERAEKVG